MKKYILNIVLGIMLICSTKITLSQGTVEDQYKQMGGIAGLSELCFGSTKVQQILIPKLGETLISNPEFGGYISKILSLYFESYDVAQKQKIIWNGTTQEYNKKAFDCSKDEDKKQILILEEQFIQEIKK